MDLYEDYETEQVTGETDSDSIASDSEQDSLLAISSSASSYFETRSILIDDIEANDEPDKTTAQAAKAIEAAAQATSARVARRRPPSVAASSISLRGSETASLLRDAGPAPPDYIQATAWRKRLGIAQSPWNDEDNAETFDCPSERQKKAHWKRAFSRHWKTLCLINLAIYCILTTTIIVVRAVAFPETSTLDFSIKLDTYPPDHPYNHWEKDERFHRNTPECQYTAFERYHRFSFDDVRNFSFIERMQPSADQDSAKVKISGHIEIRPATFTQTQQIAVIVSVGRNQQWLAGLPDIRYDESGSFQILSPNVGWKEQLHMESSYADLKRKGPSESACLDLWIGIYVKPPMDNWDMQTENLHIDIGMPYSYNRYESFPFEVRDTARISSKNGNITITDLDSAHAYVGSEAGKIEGRISLSKSLALETRSGDIGLRVQQWPFYANRYRYTNDGDPQTPARLSLTTESGNQQLSLLQPEWDTHFRGVEYPFLLESHHTSKSGRINITIDGAWEGILNATTVDGSIQLEGEDLAISPDHEDDVSIYGTRQRKEATRGALNSNMKVETQDGDIYACIGEECDHWFPTVDNYGIWLPQPFKHPCIVGDVGCRPR